MTDIEHAVRDKYGAMAESVSRPKVPSGCCGPASGGGLLAFNLERVAVAAGRVMLARLSYSDRGQ